MSISAELGEARGVELPHGTLAPTPGREPGMPARPHTLRPAAGSAVGPIAKERVIRRVQKYFFNPPAKLLVSAGLLPTTALLETKGRRTGKPRRTPVGNGLDGGRETFWIVAELGRGASWVRNIEANPRVRVKVGRRWRTGTAALLPDDDPLERQRMLSELGLGKRITAVAVRAWGTRLMTVRIDLDPASTRAVAVRGSRTAETNAVERAAEALQAPERRLLDDPYARLFVQRPLYRTLLALAPVARWGLRSLDRRYPGLHAEIMLRARYVDELVRAGGFDQLVLLGAGYDSTALRHDLPSGTRVFEVDSPQTQHAKRAVLERNGLRPEPSVAYCPCDFELDSLAGVLEEAGLDAERRSLVIWLGVSYYLTLEAFRATLRDVASFTASGGSLVLDYMDPAVIDGTTRYAGARRAAEWVAKRGEPYLLGFTVEQAGAELERAAFGVVEHLRLPELARRVSPPAGVWCRTDGLMAVLLAERK
jgi:methyltransferase (TIGR00027 family)/deazaflavin-dependent oxidoreductase (nitroreductase family)